MVRPALRSRSFRRVKVNTPSGKARTHFLKKKPGPAACRLCSKQLHGVPRDVPARIKKLPKTMRRPERPYGGNLCPACAREVFKRKNMVRWENV